MTVGELQRTDRRTAPVAILALLTALALLRPDLPPVCAQAPAPDPHESRADGDENDNRDSAAGNPASVSADMTVYDAMSTTKVDDEWGRGAVGVANLNDTDGDTRIDKTETGWTADYCVLGEEDLVKLVIQQPQPATATGAIVLEITGDGTKVTTWKSPGKAAGAQPDRSFPIGATTWPVVVYLEGMEKSSKVGEVEIYIKHGARVLDRAKATFVWVEHTDEGLRKESLWSDAKGVVRDLFNTHFLGRFGKIYWGPPAYVGHGVGFEFRVYPGGVWDLDGVRFDVTRQVESHGWRITGGTVQADPGPMYWPGRTAFTALGPTGNVIDKANDDVSDGDDNDNSPEDGNGKVYSIDAPGLWSNDGALEQVVTRQNSLEFVRVSFGGTRPAGDNTHGSRCSPKIGWWHRSWSRRRPWAVGPVTHTGTGSATWSAGGPPLRVQACCDQDRRGRGHRHGEIRDLGGDTRGSRLRGSEDSTSRWQDRHGLRRVAHVQQRPPRC